MKTKPPIAYRLATVFIPVFFVILFILQDYLITFVRSFPICPIYAHFHLYCPACGNTRSVIALLHGQILTAIHFNITPLILCIFLLLAYIELATYSFGKRIYLLPRKLGIYIILIVLLALYLVCRNFIPIYAL